MSGSFSIVLAEPVSNVNKLIKDITKRFEINYTRQGGDTLTLIDKKSTIIIKMNARWMDITLSEGCDMAEKCSIEALINKQFKGMAMGVKYFTGTFRLRKDLIKNVKIMDL